MSVDWPTGAGGAVSDATTTAKGIVKLAGDLAGTAALPTVPGLATESAARTAADALLAPKASPALTGTPTVPTAAPATNTTQAASTAYADAAVAVEASARSTAVAGSVPKSLVTAKGDLIVATASGAVTNKAVGSDGQVLTADAAQASGTRWGPGAGSLMAGRTGQWFAPPCSPVGNASTGIGFLTAIPFFVGTPTTIDQIAARVSTSAAGATINLGVYSDLSGVPNTRLIDAGTIDGSTTGTKALACALTLSGLVWLVSLLLVGSAQVDRQGRGIVSFGASSADSLIDLSIAGYSVGSQSSLPTTFPSTVGLESGNVTRIAVRGA